MNKEQRPLGIHDKDHFQVGPVGSLSHYQDFSVADLPWESAVRMVHDVLGIIGVYVMLVAFSAIPPVPAELVHEDEYIT